MTSDAKIYRDDEDDIPVYVDPDSGEHRRLGCLPSSDDELNLLRSGGVPIIPAAKWVTVTHDECKDRVEAFLSAYAINQKSHSSCVGFSAAGALMWDLWSIGFPLPGKLSGAYVYSWINNNRDAGASIVAALRALQKHGTCLESTVPWNNIYRRNIPAAADEEAKRFMLETGMTLSGFEEIASAGQVGKPVQLGVYVGRNFGSFDDEGVPGYAGRGSNHSVFLAPLLVKKAGGGFKAPMINTWGSWGPYKTGWCYLDERHINGGGGGFIHGTPNYDPHGEQPPPAA